MHLITTKAILQPVPSTLTAAKTHPRKVVLLIMAAACLFAGVAVKAAIVPSARASARTLAAQQLQIEQNPLPADLVKVQPSEVPTVPDIFKPEPLAFLASAAGWLCVLRLPRCGYFSIPQPQRPVCR